MHEQESILTGTENYDQVAELAFLKTWAKRVAGRPRRGALSAGLIKLIEHLLLVEAPPGWFCLESRAVCGNSQSYSKLGKRDAPPGY